GPQDHVLRGTKMTNNFERVLGKRRVWNSVKMLSIHQLKVTKIKKRYVELLLRVHHRHLVGLVGYCDDGDNLALIYE
ncbi:hypothetical protein HID58_069949, partial [Brassica napus]